MTPRHRACLECPRTAWLVQVWGDGSEEFMCALGHQIINQQDRASA